MQDTRMLIACVVALCSSALAVAVLSRLAIPLGLVDRPDERKHHDGSVPLVGGLAIFIGVLAGAVFYGRFQALNWILLGSSGVLVLLGSLDDRFDLSVRMRLLVQTAVILAVIFSTGVYIHSLGHLFGYDVELGWAGIPLTVVAVIGLLNAFNMMDGIDGLAGGLALISIGAISLFAGATPLRGTIVVMALLAASSLPYLAANLGFARHKIFMGDAGSMVIGYLLAWTLIQLSQITGTRLSPVDVLWCVALPVLDTLAVMYRRARQRKSPFKPDRGHIHHIVMNVGLGPRATLVALIALAAAIAFLGSVVRSLELGAGSNLVAFCIFTVIYIAIVERTWARQQARETDFRRSPAANDVRSAKVIHGSFRKADADDDRAAARNVVPK